MLKDEINENERKRRSRKGDKTKRAAVSSTLFLVFTLPPFRITFSGLNFSSFCHVGVCVCSDIASKLCSLIFRSENGRGNNSIAASTTMAIKMLQIFLKFYSVFIFHFVRCVFSFFLQLPWTSRENLFALIFSLTLLTSEMQRKLGKSSPFIVVMRNEFAPGFSLPITVKLITKFWYPWNQVEQEWYLNCIPSAVLPLRRSQ